MEITSIESKVFEEMMSRFEEIKTKVEILCKKLSTKKVNEWLDNQNVCQKLHISPRTLQTLRDKGVIRYTQVNRKIYYQPEEIQRITPIIKKN